MNEDRYSEEELQVIRKYEKRKPGDFFDVEEMELVIEYYLFGGNLAKAEKALNYAFEFHPNNSLLLCQKAAILSQKGQLDEALLLIEANGEADDTVHQFTHAEVLLKLGRTKEALKIFRKIVKMASDEDDDVEGLCMDIVNLLSGNQCFNECRYFAECGLEHNPENLELRESYAVALSYSGCNDNCIEMYNQILDQDPYRVSTWLYLGLAYFEMQQYGKACEAFDYALAIEPENELALLQRAYCAYNLAEYEDTIRFGQKYLLVAPEIDHDDTAHNMMLLLAECLVNIGKLETALSYYLDVAQQEPLSADAYYGAAVCSFHLEHIDDALKYVQSAIACSDEEVADHYVLLGRIYTEKEQDDDAKNAYQQATRINPAHALAWYWFGHFCMSKNDYKHALQHFEHACDLDASIDGLPLSLSLAYFALADYDKAQQYLNQARNVASIEHIKELYASMFPNAFDILKL